MTERKHSVPPLFQNNQVLFGHDSTPGLIACEIEGVDNVRLYLRVDGETRLELAPFVPLLVLEGDDGLKGWTGEAKVEELTGSGSFNRLVLFPDLKQLDERTAKSIGNTVHGK